MRRADSFKKTLMLGKIEGGRRRGRQRMRWWDGITDSTDMSLSNSGSWRWTGRPGTLQSMGSQRVGHDWATELNWLSQFKAPNICHFTWLPSPLPWFLVHSRGFLRGNEMCSSSSLDFYIFFFPTQQWKAHWNSRRAYTCKPAVLKLLPVLYFQTKPHYLINGIFIPHIGPNISATTFITLSARYQEPPVPPLRLFRILICPAVRLRNCWCLNKAHVIVQMTSIWDAWFTKTRRSSRWPWFCVLWRPLDMGLAETVWCFLPGRRLTVLLTSVFCWQSDFAAVRLHYGY